jgi:hypothetical protein
MTTYSDGQHDNSTTIISDIRCAKNTKSFNGKDGNEKRNPCSENDLCSLKRNSEKEKRNGFNNEKRIFEGFFTSCLKLDDLRLFWMLGLKQKTKWRF